jgi:hypothetical protein
MEILRSYEFKKPSKSRYAPVVKALVEDGVFAVRLVRGTDFPSEATIDSVQGAVSQQVRNAGRRARTFAESLDALIVSLYPEGEGPRRRRTRAKASA